MEIFGVFGLDTILIIIFAVFYYKAAEMENAPKFLCMGLSLIVSLIVRILSLGLLGLILGQAVLFIAIGAVRVLLGKWR